MAKNQEGFESAVAPVEMDMALVINLGDVAVNTMGGKPTGTNDEFGDFWEGHNGFQS